MDPIIPVDLRANSATSSVLAAHSFLVFHSSVTLAVHSLMTHVLLIPALLQALLQALARTLHQYLSAPSAPSLTLPPLVLIPHPPLVLIPHPPLLPLPPLVLIPPPLLPLPLAPIPPHHRVPGVHGATVDLVRTRNTIITENIKDITANAIKP